MIHSFMLFLTRRQSASEFATALAVYPDLGKWNKALLSSHV